MTEPTLTGLFFIQECGDHYHTGEIIRQAHPDAYLAKIDRITPDMPVDPLILFTVSGDLSNCDDDGHPQFRFFETRADLQAWIDWLDTPVEKPDAVVKLVKPEKRH